MEWKKIEEYENYSVNKNGEVRNDKTGRVLKLQYNHGGYQYVHLYKNRKLKYFFVHRLVAEAFIPNPENKPYVDHINTIKDDNRVENLKWCTHKENCNNPLTLKNNSEAHKGENNPMFGRTRESHPKWSKKLSNETRKKISENHANVSGSNNPRCRKVICITTGEIFDFIKQASEKYEINRQNISSCCSGKYKSAGKHPVTGEKLVWMYLEDYKEMK